jgi:hypothetical protein
METSTAIQCTDRECRGTVLYIEKRSTICRLARKIISFLPRGSKNNHKCRHRSINGECPSHVIDSSFFILVAHHQSCPNCFTVNYSCNRQYSTVQYSTVDYCSNSLDDGFFLSLDQHTTTTAYSTKRFLRILKKISFVVPPQCYLLINNNDDGAY